MWKSCTVLGGGVGGHGSLPGRVEQGVVGLHQFAHLHGDIAELVTQEAPEAQEGGGVAHDPLRLRDHLAPVRSRRRGAGKEAPPLPHFPS